MTASAVVALSSCSLIINREPPRLESTPTNETVAPELASFYSQVLTWRPCHEQFQCATAMAPLDWSDPQRDSIELALIRHTANSPRASLLINPGGPGGSGVDMVRDSMSFAVGQRLIENFDIVGFDPRGVGESSAISCAED